MPVQYTGIIEEHLAVRQAAGLFDVSHMGEVTVEGPGAQRFLDTLVTNDVSKLSLSQGLYTPMCYGDGGVVDDLIIYRVGETAYLLVINASNIEKDYRWMEEVAEPFDCELKNVSSDYALLALQGPKAEAILDLLKVEGGGDLGRFFTLESKIQGIRVRVARTGYTGEAGVEIFCHWNDGPVLAQAILTAGAPVGLKLAGLGARDSLRLEAGYPLYGHEISERINPLRGGIGWTVKFKKAVDFLGKAPLQEEKTEGIPEKVVYFSLEGRRIGRQGSEVMSQDQVVGRVLSGTHSPVIGKPIGSALIQAGALESGDLTLDLRGNRLPLQIKKPPLHL